MGIDFPLSSAAMLTVVGSTAFATIMGMWLKAYLKDWRFTNLLVLSLGLLFAGLAQCIASAWRPTGEALLAAFLIGLIGASLATFGYETVVNLLGKFGSGRRSDEALLATAEVMVTKTEDASQ